MINKKMIAILLSAALTASGILPVSAAEAQTKKSLNLDNVLQSGGLFEKTDGEGSLENVGSYLDAESYVVSQLQKWGASSASCTVNVSSYSIPAYDSTLKSLLGIVLNNHPELFYVSNNIQYSSWGYYAESLVFYRKSGFTASDIPVFDEKVDEILDGVDPEFNDLQKVLYIHDYIVTHAQYDLSLKKFDAYSALVNESAVCQGYSLAFKYLLNKLGIGCDMITSNGLNHAWNLVTIGSQKFFADCTWDDPVGSVGTYYKTNALMYPSYCQYTYFLKSRDEFGHTENSSYYSITDWVNAYGNDVYSNNPSSTALDNAFWTNQNIASKIPVKSDKAYYAYNYGSAYSLRVFDMESGSGSDLTTLALWPYSDIERYGTQLIVAGQDKIFVIDREDGTLIKTVNNPYSYYDIYGIDLDGNTVTYHLGTGPSESELQTSGTFTLDYENEQDSGYVIQYTVTYETNGGSEADPVTVDRNSLLTEPAEITKEGYAFDGWYKDAELTEAWDFSSDKVKSNMTLFAKWNKIHTVAFDSMGGSAVSSQEVVNGDTLTKPTNPYFDGIRFLGWYRDKECTDEWNFYLDSVTEDITLYAKWDTVTVTFQSEGVTISSQTIGRGQTLSEPEMPVRSGYEFQGWGYYDYWGEIQEWDFDSDRVNQDLSLYAIWTEESPAEDTESDNNADSKNEGNEDESNEKPQAPQSPSENGAEEANNAENNVTDQTDDISDSDNTLSENAIKDSDTVPSGNDVNGSDTAPSGNDVNDSDTVPSGNDVNGSDTVPSENTLDDSTKAPSGNETDETDTAKDSTLEDTTPSENANGDSGEKSNDEHKDEVTYYTVGFDSNEGTPIYPQQVSENGLVEEPVNPTKNGYVFNGWYVDSGFTTPWDFDHDRVSSNLTLYAKWTEIAKEPEVFTVTFNTGDGSAVTPQKVEAGSLVSRPADPAHEKFIFSGWYKNPTLTQLWDFDADKVTSNVTLYAKWVENETENNDKSSDSDKNAAGLSKNTAEKPLNSAGETVSKNTGSVFFYYPESLAYTGKSWKKSLISMSLLQVSIDGGKTRVPVKKVNIKNSNKIGTATITSIVTDEGVRFSSSDLGGNITITIVPFTVSSDNIAALTMKRRGNGQPKVTVKVKMPDGNIRKIPKKYVKYESITNSLTFSEAYTGSIRLQY
ncbi:MAG: InlB B-repeat-containing protein [Lachnospiraceae bacterium]|nr:InlB B-repeat-containing protein [Lachnospiraceae bacterium]